MKNEKSTFIFETILNCRVFFIDSQIDPEKL